MSLLKQLEQQIADRLISGAFFAGLTVLADPQKNIVAEIEQNIAKLKTLVAPLVTGASDESPNVPSPYFNSIDISVGIFQNPLLKGGDPAVWDIAEQVEVRLKGWMPDGLSNVLTAKKPTIERIADRKLNILSVGFETKGGFIAQLEQVATPVLSRAGNTITLTCDTPLAPIYYTTDPAVLNPGPFAGALYTSPFAINPPAILRARAGRWGWLASQILTHRVT